MIDDLPPLREMVARHGLDARKALGQNFLYDLNLTARIARAAGPLEGVTTSRSVRTRRPHPSLLAQGAAKVIAVERDARCLPALAEIAAHYPGRLTVIEGDALELDPLNSCVLMARADQPGYAQICPTMWRRFCSASGSKPSPGPNSSTVMF